MSNKHAPLQTVPAQAERWVMEHGDFLYRYALQRVRDSHAAEDLVQETLLAAMTSASSFMALSAERTWLIGILKHKLIDRLRKSIHQQPVTKLQAEGNLDPFDKNGHWKVRVSKWHGDPREIAENIELQKVLASCLSKLPPQIAEVFRLYEVEAMSSKELCKELEISPTNVWTMLHRARLRLQRCLDANWFEGGDR